MFWNVNCDFIWRDIDKYSNTNCWLDTGIMIMLFDFKSIINIDTPPYDSI